MRFGTELVDTHCHLADYSDPVGVLRDATAANVHIVAVTRTPTEYRTLRTRLGSRPGVTVALGMHPQQPEAATQPALARFFQLAPNAAFLGEVGLDFTDADTAVKRAQRRTFDAVCDELSARPRPVTVHSRGAAKATVESLRSASVTAILHWFTGPMTVAEAAIADGHAFSVNAAMTRSTSGRALLALVPPDRVLLETDGPFVRMGGKPAEPSLLSQVVTALARTWATDTATARERLSTNQQRLLNDRLPQTATSSVDNIGGRP